MHQDHSALFERHHLFAVDGLVAVVLVDVLFAVAAGQDHQIAHFGFGQVGGPEADLDLQRQLGREGAVGHGAGAVGMPDIVALAAGRADEELALVQLEQLAEKVVGVADVRG